MDHASPNVKGILVIEKVAERLVAYCCTETQW